MGEPTDPLLGTVVAGRYRVVRRIGRGGMGTVYVADQSPLHREVAIKVLRQDLAADDVAVERFRREAQVIAQLGHPHVVGVYDFGATDNGTLFIAMELLRGEDLLTRLRRKGPLSWPRALHIVEQIARAIAGAHAHGVIHRDLKPANVLLLNADGARDFVKVVDFGIAKLVREGKSAVPASLTGEGFVPGTVGYIAPENISGGTADDPRADLYSLGVTLFEMLTGRCPFIGDSAMRILLQQLNDDPPRPSTVTKLGVPVEIENLVMRLISRLPEGRPATANAFLDELAVVRRALAGSEPDTPADDDDAPAEATVTSAGRGTPWTGLPSQPAATQLRSRVAAGVGVFAVVFAAGLAVWLWTTRQHGVKAVPADAVYYPTPPRSLPEALPEAPLATSPLPFSTAHAGPATTEQLPQPSPTPLATRPPVSPKTPHSPAPTAAATPTAAVIVPETAPETVAAPSVDDVWRDDAAAALSVCRESCAKAEAGALRALDLTKLTDKIRIGVNECVARCKRKGTAP